MPTKAPYDNRNPSEAPLPTLLRTPAPARHLGRFPEDEHGYPSVDQNPTCEDQSHRRKGWQSSSKEVYLSHAVEGPLVSRSSDNVDTERYDQLIPGAGQERVCPCGST